MMTNESRSKRLRKYLSNSKTLLAKHQPTPLAAATTTLPMGYNLISTTLAQALLTFMSMSID